MNVTPNYSLPLSTTSYVQTQLTAARAVLLAYTQLDAIAARIAGLDAGPAAVPAAYRVTRRVSTGKMALSIYVRHALTQLTAAVAYLSDRLTAESLSAPAVDLYGNSVNHTNLRVSLKRALPLLDTWMLAANTALDGAGGGGEDSVIWYLTIPAPLLTDGQVDPGDTIKLGDVTYTFVDTPDAANELKISAGNSWIDYLTFIFTLFNDDTNLAAYITAGNIGPGTVTQVNNEAGITLNAAAFTTWYGQVTGTGGAGPWGTIIFDGDLPFNMEITSAKAFVLEVD